jgi:hypothetical protein
MNSSGIVSWYFINQNEGNLISPEEKKTCYRYLHEKPRALPEPDFSQNSLYHLLSAKLGPFLTPLLEKVSQVSH